MFREPGMPHERLLLSGPSFVCSCKIPFDSSDVHTFSSESNELKNGPFVSNCFGFAMNTISLIRCCHLERVHDTYFRFYRQPSKVAALFRKSLSSLYHFSAQKRHLVKNEPLIP
jgi:hypothetical protein